MLSGSANWEASSIYRKGYFEDALWVFVYVLTVAPHWPILYTEAAENSVHTFDVMQWIVA
jgi:hypothetical protein